MKAIGSALISAQSGRTVTPAVKVRIQEYGFPAEDPIVRFNKFDLIKVLESDNASGACACCASDGSFVITDGTTTARFATPTLATNFATGWKSAGTMTSFARCTSYAIASNPTNGEVLIVRDSYAYPTHTLTYKQSTDYGATWGGWTALGTIAPAFGTLYGGYGMSGHAVGLAFNASGNCLVYVSGACYTMDSGYTYYYAKRGTGFIKRTSGTWGTATTQVATHGLSDPQWSVTLPMGGATQIQSIEAMSVSVAWDGDWIVAHTWTQTYSFNTKSGLYITVVGDGTLYTYPNTSGHDIATYSETTVNSVVDITGTSFSISGNLQNAIGAFIKTGKSFSIDEAANPDTSLCLLPIDFPMLCNMHSGDSDEIMQFNEEVAYDAANLTNGMHYEHAYPLQLCANDTYVFFVNNGEIFMSLLPSYWEVPVAGSGAGSYTELSAAEVFKVNEDAKQNSVAELEILLDNSNGNYDTVGADNLAYLTEGSRVSLYLGYKISGADTFYEYARYFVKDWGWTRNPNQSLFILHCIDAWGLLEKFVFSREVNFNKFSEDYHIYDLIEMLINAIGGTLTYTTRSTDITSIYPRISTRPPDTAASILRRLLTLVKDTIKFTGNDAVIVYPQTSDSSVYDYYFPD